MPYQQNGLADFMQGARTLIENAIASPEFATILAGYGYDTARLEEGRSLWAEVDGLAKKQVADYGGQYEATQRFEKAWATANAAESRGPRRPKRITSSALAAASSSRASGGRGRRDA